MSWPGRRDRKTGKRSGKPPEAPPPPPSGARGAQLLMLDPVAAQALFGPVLLGVEVESHGAG
jgi:hypothetical protein